MLAHTARIIAMNNLHVMLALGCLAMPLLFVQTACPAFICTWCGLDNDPPQLDQTRGEFGRKRAVTTCLLPFKNEYNQGTVRQRNEKSSSDDFLLKCRWFACRELHCYTLFGRFSTMIPQLVPVTSCLTFKRGTI